MIDHIFQEIIKKSSSDFSCETSVKPVVYIAGPFASAPEENTEKAIKLGKVATSLNFAPLVPHTTILSGAYGDDEVIQERENGMVVTLSLLLMVARTNDGHLWVIESEDGTLSKGTQLEYDLWCSIRRLLQFPLNAKIKKYRDWVSQRVAV